MNFLIEIFLISFIGFSITLFVFLSSYLLLDDGGEEGPAPMPLARALARALGYDRAYVQPTYGGMFYGTFPSGVRSVSQYKIVAGTSLSVSTVVGLVYVVASLSSILVVLGLLFLSILLLSRIPSSCLRSPNR